MGPAQRARATTPSSSSTPSPATATSSAPPGRGTPSPGWWDGLIGPGRPLDTDRWFVVASNVLGGCQGTTGPVVAGAGRAAVGEPVPLRDGPRPGRRRGRASPTTSASPRWAAVLGGSMGGMRVLEWAVTHPDAGRPRPRARQHGVRHGRPDRLVPAAAARDPARPGLPRRRLLRRSRRRARTPAWGSRGGSPT